MVVVDPTCISPMKYDQLEILNGIIAKSSVRIVVGDALHNKTWRKVNAPVDTSFLDDQWRKEFTTGAQQLLKETWVKATEPHYDAKVFPNMHPYGTGSLSSEIGSGGANGIPRLCRNRLLLVQSCFRNNSLWVFWNLQRMITSQLFHQEALKKKQSRRHTSSADDKDPVTRHFGTVMPSCIPESPDT